MITFGSLVGGAGGRGGACLNLKNLQNLKLMIQHALLPLRGCGEYVKAVTVDRLAAVWMLLIN